MPIEATTSSLEALKYFNIGLTMRHNEGDESGIPFLRRAITDALRDRHHRQRVRRRGKKQPLTLSQRTLTQVVSGCARPPRHHQPSIEAAL